MASHHGDLEVLLKYARGLRDVDLIGRQDPYCVLTCNGVQRTSKTKTDGGRNPVWNEAFGFRQVSPKSILKLKFYDKNVLFKDSFIGECAVDNMLQVIVSGRQEVTVPVLTEKGVHQGEVQLRLTFRTYKPSGANKGHAHAPKAASPDAVPERPRSPATPAPCWILPTYGDRDCWKDYKMGKLLGSGGFGKTYEATKNDTGEVVAVKVISKKRITDPLQVEDIKREVRIMHHLAGHPNVVCIKDAYEDEHNVCLVMELCSGGELFDAIVKRGSYSEKDAAALMHSIISVVAHCHMMGVIHRDLKPQNFLLSDNTPGAVLKTADFGLSTFFKEGQVFKEILGSTAYVAPEVLKRSYNKEADIWSCGVILYILLSGRAPYVSEDGDKHKTFEKIMKEMLDLQSAPWGQISEPAKDCVRRMLQRDPKRRATAQEILEHDWMRENGVATNTAIENEVLSRIRKFSAGNRLKKEAIKIMASTMPEDEISGLREIFTAIDIDKQGISGDELAAALKRKGKILTDAEVAALMKSADVNGDGRIDYQEFLAATVGHIKLQSEQRLRAAFKQFDRGNKGHISHEDLTRSLAKMGVDEHGVKEIIAEVGFAGNGTIDFNEFCHMFTTQQSLMRSLA